MFKESYKKYSDEGFIKLHGLYHEFDSTVLYTTVRGSKPTSIIDLGPRGGRTTSCIINAINKNLKEDSNHPKIIYYLFEKDTPFLDKVKEYLINFVNENGIEDKVEFHFNENIIDSPVIGGIDKVDFLFIDALHDYIISSWYVDTLFPKVKTDGVIHIHDIFYNRFNSGWGDVIMREEDKHPDYTNLDLMRGFYPTIFDRYYHGEDIVTEWESTVIRDFYVNNEGNLEFFSTNEYAKELGVPTEGSGIIPISCSVYFKKL